MRGVYIPYALLEEKKITANILAITIDGPGSVGEGTLCKTIAKALDRHLLDSGVTYHVLTLAALRHHVDVESEEALVSLVARLDMRFIPVDGTLEVVLEGENVNDEIHTQEVINAVSKVVAFSHVCEVLLRHQCAFRELPGFVTDGCDIGTIVFPNAPVKIFLDASADERARRRIRQLQEKGFNANFERLLSEIKERDDYDRNRAVTPLVPAADTLVLDLAGLNIEQVIEETLQYTHEKLTVA